jgi:hypothetical protein
MTGLEYNHKDVTFRVIHFIVRAIDRIEVRTRTGSSIGSVGFALKTILNFKNKSIVRDKIVGRLEITPLLMLSPLSSLRHSKGRRRGRGRKRGFEGWYISNVLLTLENNDEAITGLCQRDITLRSIENGKLATGSKLAFSIIRTFYRHRIIPRDSKHDEFNATFVTHFRGRDQGHISDTCEEFHSGESRTQDLRVSVVPVIILAKSFGLFPPFDSSKG